MCSSAKLVNGSLFVVAEFRSKDHLRENVRRMRQIQRLSKQREQEAHQPVKVIWKSEKYATVESRIKAEILVCTPT